MRERTATKGLLHTVGSGITRARNFFINTVFVLFVIFLLVGALNSCQSLSVPNGAALIINPAGVLIEAQTVPQGWQDVLVMNPQREETELGALLAAIELARTDDDITTLILDLDELVSISPAQANRLGESLQNFKTSGKQVISYGDYYSQEQYHVASFADAVYMHPMGQLLLTGYGGNNLYYKDLLEKFKVNVHVFRVGDYKSATEPMTRNNMSEESRLAGEVLYLNLWQHFVADVAANRKLDEHRVQAFSDEIAAAVTGARGDFARAALEANLLDELLTTDQAIVRMADAVGYADASRQHLNAIDFRSYLQARNYSRSSPSGGAGSVAVIVAQGPIMANGEGGRTVDANVTIDLIRQARFDDDIRALVVRVDSPGGSKFAAELIRQELELVQLAGKPVVASFASYAASGGYWISATADKIVSEPTTLTGSIGIFSLVTTFEQSLAHVGIYNDGVRTTAQPLNLDLLTGISEEMARLLQANVEHGYEQFINIVARGRQMQPEQVQALAQGRVWSGEDALALGLVDELGGLEAALQSAGELANLSSYQVRYLTPPRDPRSQLLASLMQSSAKLIPDLTPVLTPDLTPDLTQTLSGVGGRLLAPLLAAGRKFEQLDDPFNVYVLCESCFWADLTSSQ